MKKVIRQETITGAILIILLVLITNSGNLLMPSTLDTMLTISITAVFIFYLAVIWKEKTKDERELSHKLNAGRWAFLVGSTLAVFGIVIESASHNVDPWLLYTVIAMIITKIISRLVSEHTN